MVKGFSPGKIGIGFHVLKDMVQVIINSVDKL